MNKTKNLQSILGSKRTQNSESKPNPIQGLKYHDARNEAIL